MSLAPLHPSRAMHVIAGARAGSRVAGASRSIPPGASPCQCSFQNLVPLCSGLGRGTIQLPNVVKVLHIGENRFFKENLQINVGKIFPKCI